MISQNESTSSHVRRCVLITYGNPDAVSSLSLMLERSGHLVNHLAPGKAAVSEVVLLKPDVVLLLGLPDADARRLASELRKKPISRRAIISISRFEPADEADLLAAIEKVPRKRDAAASPRLLLVEDNAPLAEATAEFLRAAGLEVRIVESGEEALAMARVFQPEIILCDVYLPDMSGLDVARALRANPKTKYAVVALHSAMPDLELRALKREIHKDEVDLFLSKPLTPQKIDSLLAALDAVRQSARLQRYRRAG